ncbi:unnamed protein product [Clonostachys byssicola]|uniref:Uncharacterized protein n=1 Tax=Clonostachys byssicola TaxID=160290 RepID=A0A9N9YAQ6_9HYPO|nr:unnamed protein product [Clonostachys byssicola]
MGWHQLLFYSLSISLASLLCGNHYSTRQDHIYPNDQIDNPQQQIFWINWFLDGLRSNFPRVQIVPNSTIGSSDTEMGVMNWLNQNPAALNGPRFPARLAGNLRLNEVVIETAVLAHKTAFNPLSSSPEKRKAITNWTIPHDRNVQVDPQIFHLKGTKYRIEVDYNGRESSPISLVQITTTMDVLLHRTSIYLIFHD